MNIRLCSRTAGALLLAAAALPATAKIAPILEPLPAGVQQQLDRARDARQHGDLRVALLLLKNAAQAAPDNAAIQAELGTVLAMEGQTAQAERTLRQAMKLGAPKEQVLPALFQTMLSQHEYQAVLDQFPEPAAGAKLASDTLRARALALFALGKAPEADAAIDKALAIGRTAPLLVNKAEFAVARGQRAEAAQLADEALKAAPRNTSALVLKIGLLERQGAYDKAIAFADRLVQSSPGQTLPLVLRFELLAKLQRYREAGSDVDRLLTIAPKLPIGLYDRALLLAQKGDIKGAWQIAQALPPNFLHSDPQFELGFAGIAQAAGNAELSLAALTAAVATFPKSAEARRALAQRQLESRDFAAALATMQPMQPADNPGDMVLRAKAYAGLGQNRQAQELYARAKASPGTGAAKDVDQLIQASKSHPADEEAAGTLITVLIAQGRTKDADQVADRFEKAAPKNQAARLFRAEIAMAQGDLDHAESGLNSFLHVQPNSIPALYYLAQVEAARGNFAKAQSRLDLVLKKDPRNIQALTKKAQYALQSGNEDDAIALLKRAASLGGDALEPKLALGELYLSLGSYQQAQSIGAAAVKRFPEDTRAAALLARADVGLKNPDGARAVAAALVKKSPKSAQAQILLASVLEQTGDQKGAAAAYSAALDAEPAAPDAAQAAAAYYLRHDQNDRAIAAAREGAKKLAQPEADLSLADVMVRAGDRSAATELLERSFKRAPASRTLLALATLEAASNRKDMEGRLADWLTAHPRDVAIRGQLATLLMADGNITRAKAELEKSLVDQPYNPSILNDLAWVLQKSDGARALKLAGLAAKISPRSGEILDTLAWLTWQQHDRKQGLALLQRAHKLSPAQPSIAYHLAVALAQSGDRAGALAVLQVALKAGGDESNRAQAVKLQALWDSSAKKRP